LLVDALATLKDYSSQHGDVLRSQGYAEGYMMSEITSKLIQTCCEKNDVARSVELLSLLFDSGYVKSGAFDVLSQLVSGYINKYAAFVLTAHEFCFCTDHSLKLSKQ
jgi:hypothetical protein